VLLCIDRELERWLKTEGMDNVDLKPLDYKLPCAFLFVFVCAAHKLVRRAEEGQGSASGRGRDGVRLNGQEDGGSGCKC